MGTKRSVFLAFLSGLLGIGAIPAAGDTANQLFVQRAEHDLLGRAPSAVELSTFAGLLDSHALSTDRVAAAIEDSDEFRVIETTAEYRDLLGRGPNAAELAGGQGFLGGGGTVEQLQATLAGGAEYFLKGGNTNDGFITAIYSDLLNRSANRIERASAESALSAGETRTSFATGILSGVEYDRDLVSSIYGRFLHRSPTITERDIATNELQSQARDEQINAQVIGKSEYFNQPLLSGDADFDRSVGFADLLILARNYGKTEVHWSDGDFSGDGRVGFEDLLDLARDYGKSLPNPAAAAVQLPEPSAIVGLSAIAALVSRRRRMH